MGYDIHITRAEGWVDSAERPIALDEWLAYAAADPELEPEGGEFVVFRGHVGETWLDWREGEIFTKNPTRVVVAKMHAIAAALDAHVQVDEGEEYDERGEPIDEERVQPTRRGALGSLLLVVPFFAVLNAPLVGSLCLLAILAGLTTLVASWFIFAGTALVLALVLAVVAVLAGYAGAVSRVVA